MIASLPMYHRLELAAAHSEFWRLVHAKLTARNIAAPAKLDQSAEGLETWLSPDLCLSQTCGRPYKLHLHGRVNLIGTPDYRLADCPAGYYRSILIAHSGDARKTLAEYDGAMLAYNQKMSQSGFAAPIDAMTQAGGTFAAGVRTGAHLKSIAAVQSKSVDIAGIDALTWHYFIRFHDASNLQVVGYSRPTPTLPFITRAGENVAAYRDALRGAIAALPENTHQLLRLNSLVEIDASEYLKLYEPTPDQVARLTHSNG